MNHIKQSGIYKFFTFRRLYISILILIAIYLAPLQALAQACPPPNNNVATPTALTTMSGVTATMADKYYQVSGGTVTLTNCNLTFKQDARINVKTGGRLIIIHSKLVGVSTTCAWQGIIVEGNGSTQYIGCPACVRDTISQGYVRITAGSIIKYAKRGIYAPGSTLAGGIIVSHVAHFIDNNYGIYIDQNGITEPNASTVMNDKGSPKKHSASWINKTTFEYNTAFSGSDFTGQWGVYLTSAQFTEISGCTFTNHNTTLHGNDVTRGGGISVNGSQAAVHSEGDLKLINGSDSCYVDTLASSAFDSLSIGVDVDTSSSFGINNANFYNTFQGIHIVDGHHQTIKNDTFIFTYDTAHVLFSTNSMHYFIKTFNATDLLIYGNYASSNWSRTTHFIDIDNSQNYPSEIYMNKLVCRSTDFGIHSPNDWPIGTTTAPSVYGIFFTDDNTGVAVLKCDTFVGMEFDIYISGPFAPYIGWYGYGAHDVFSDTVNCAIENIWNDDPSNYMYYWYHDAACKAKIIGYGLYESFTANAETSCTLLGCTKWPASVNRVIANMELDIFPNPANDHLTVRYNRVFQGNNLTM